MKKKVFVADDSFFSRRLISKLIKDSSKYQFAGQAANLEGLIAGFFKKDIDLLVLGLSGLAQKDLGRLNRVLADQDILPGVVFLSSPEEYKKLEGYFHNFTVGFVSRPKDLMGLRDQRFKKELSLVLKTISSGSKVDDLDKFKKNSLEKQNYCLIVVGSSTGGPGALEVLLPALPRNFPVPIVVAQHMRPQFIKSMVNRLDEKCKLKVKLAKQGERIISGKVYFADGKKDMILKGSCSVMQSDYQINDRDELTNPSIDLVMKSAVKICGAKVVGLILTGMGDDGLKGIEAIKKAGGYSLVQDEATSAVYGMAKEVVDNNFADEVLPLEKIPKKLIDLAYE